MRRVALVVAALAASACVADAADYQNATTGRVPAARPPQLDATERCLLRAERRRVFRFAAADGTRLVGVLLGKGPKGVVLAHQGSGNFCQWFPYARTLARSGFRVLAFDFRIHGASDIPNLQSHARRFDLDVIAAVNVLRKRGATSTLLAGGSLGAAAVLVVAARLEPRVQGVVSLSGPERVWDLDAEAAARQLQAPVLFVAAEDDANFADVARSLYEESAAPDKQLLVLPEGGHGTSLLRIAAVRTALVAFFRAHS